MKNMRLQFYAEYTVHPLNYTGIFKRHGPWTFFRSTFQRQRRVTDDTRRKRPHGSGVRTRLLTSTFVSEYASAVRTALYSTVQYIIGQYIHSLIIVNEFSGIYPNT